MVCLTWYVLPMAIITHLGNLMARAIAWIFPGRTSMARIRLRVFFVIHFFVNQSLCIIYLTCPGSGHISVMETLRISHFRFSQSCRFLKRMVTICSAYYLHLSVPSEHLPRSGHHRHSRSALLQLSSGAAKHSEQLLCILQVSNALNTMAVSFLMCLSFIFSL